MCCRFYIDKESPEMQKIIAQMNCSLLMQRWPSTQFEAFAVGSQPSSLHDGIPSSPPQDAQIHSSASIAAASMPSATTPLDIRPTDLAPVIAPDRNGQPAIFPMQWGYNARSLLINARVETAAEKPTFREDWIRHRCIIPASGYYEWEHLSAPDSKSKTGDKYAIHPMHSTMTWLCGLYRIEAGLPHFVVLTREPADSIRFIHDRMPLLLSEEHLFSWLAPTTNPADILPHAITDMTFLRIS